MHPIIQQAFNGKRDFLEPECWEVLKSYDLPTPSYRWVLSSTQAKESALSLEFPMILKVVSPDIIHKTDVGGIIMGLRNPDEVEAGYKELERIIQKKRPESRWEGAILVKQLPKGREVILGKFEDPQLGPALMLGIGGIFTEILGDVVFRLLPLTSFDAQEMVSDLKFRSVLQGTRGEGPVDIEALYQAIFAFGRLIEENPVIKECDLNPIFLYEKGLYVVDARMSILR